MRLVKKSELQLLLAVFSVGLVACNVAATRPIQEMSNADIAIHAAKDLNADSLTPETYRNAVDHYFKAKRDYRLKNFDQARSHALKATRLAEQAEFEAYRMGGATPEAAARVTSPEGSVSDADAAFKNSSPDNSAVVPDSKPAPTKKDINPNEAGADSEADKEKKDEKPAGQTGPAIPAKSPGSPTNAASSTAPLITPNQNNYDLDQDYYNFFEDPENLKAAEKEAAKKNPGKLPSYDAPLVPKMEPSAFPSFSPPGFSTFGSDPDKASDKSKDEPPPPTYIPMNKRIEPLGAKKETE